VFRIRISQKDQEDRSFEVEGPEVVIGRSRSCDVTIAAPYVSQRHAKVVAGVAVIDLESTNGTFISGERLRHGGVLPGNAFALGTPPDEIEVEVEVTAEIESEGLHTDSSPVLRTTIQRGSGGSPWQPSDAEHDTLERKIQDLKHQLAAAKNDEASQAAPQVSKLQTERKALEDDVHRLQLELHELRKQTDDQVRAKELANSLLDERTEENQQLRAELERSRELASAAENRMESTRTALERARRELKQAEEERARAQERSSKSETECERLALELETSRAKLQKLAHIEGEVEELRGGLQAREAELERAAEWEARNEKLSSEADGLRLQAESSQQKLEDVTRINEALEETAERQGSEIRRLEEELEIARRGHSERRETAPFELESELEAAREHEAALQKSLVDQRERLTRTVRLEAQCARLQTEVAELRARLESESNRDELEVLRGQLTLRQHEIERLKVALTRSGDTAQEVEALRAQLEERGAEVERLRTALDEASETSHFRTADTAILLEEDPPVEAVSVFDLSALRDDTPLRRPNEDLAIYVVRRACRFVREGERLINEACPDGSAPPCHGLLVDRLANTATADAQTRCEHVGAYFDDLERWLTAVVEAPLEAALELVQSIRSDLSEEGLTRDNEIPAFLQLAGHTQAQLWQRTVQYCQTLSDDVIRVRLRSLTGRAAGQLAQR